MKITTTAMIHIPRPPNFLRYGDDDQTIDVADVRMEDLRKIGAAWTEALVENHIQRATARKLGKTPASTDATIKETDECDT